MNPYTSNSSYMTQADIGYPQVQYQSQPQDTSMQDMFQNQAMQQMGQLAGGQSTGASNPMALAMALRNFGKDQAGSNPLFDRAMAFLDVKQSPTQQAEISKLGSSSWNPLSGYNTGFGGWGSYGE